MSNPSRFLAITAALLLVLSSTSLAHAARSVDPSGRVARLSHTQGGISYSPAGEDAWLDAERNRPLIRGDRLWTDRNAHAELQVGNAAVRLGADTSFEILNLNDRMAQVSVTQGTLNLRVRRLYPGQSYEVATPTLAFTVNRPGRYRIDVDGHDNETTIVVWEGAGVAYGDRTSFPLRAGDAVRFYGGDLRDHELSGLPRADAFDRYCLGRDRRLDRSASLRYLDDDVVGYADLDDYGSWRPARGYGTVWFPSRVAADWAPYRDGHWVWQEPWGWTWVDHAPWGFAPSHYGRWVHVSNRWGWVPGPRNVRPVYAPALVAFVGGRGWSVSLSFGARAPIGWFPLAPREVYVPSYSASRDYFSRVNVNNTVVNNTTITNVYNNNYISTTNINTTNVTQVTYANRAVAGAVTAVPGAVFVNAQPVQAAAIRIEGAAVTTGEITRVAPVAPSARSVLGAGETTRTRPSREVQDRPVVARSAPPPARRPFAAREQQLQQTPGQAPEPAPVQATAGAAVAIAPNVRVIAEQPGAVDARAAGSRRGGGKAAARTDGPLPPLERAQPRQGQGAAPPPTASEPPAAAQQRAAAAEQEQRQRKAEGEKAVKEEQAGRQRQAERERQVAAQHQAEQQRLAQEQEKQRKGKAQNEQRQVAEQQRVERERLANQQQQEQRRLKAEGEAQAVGRERAERERVAEARRLEQAECERLAVEKKQDKRQCRNGTPAKPPRAGKGNAGGPDAGQSGD